MDETWKRLNTYVSPETKRLVKLAAADMSLPLPETVDYLIRAAFNSLPASGSRPEPMVRQQLGPNVSEHNPEGPGGTDGLVEPIRKDINPDEIVRCGLCGQEMPQSAKEIHEENCRRSQQGYWDRKAFSV